MHYVGTTAAALAIVLTIVVAAARADGYRNAGRSAAAGLLVLGTASLLFSSNESAFPTVWAVLSLAGAVATVVATHRPATVMGGARSTSVRAA